MPKRSMPYEFDWESRKKTIGGVAKAITCISIPATLRFLHYQEAGKLGFLNKTFYGLILDNDSNWRVLCRMVATEYGLYVPERPHHLWKKHFFDVVWPSRTKWVSVYDNFSIRVSARFRPGESTTQDKVHVPLHQRMLIMKKGEQIVEGIPDRFKDALLGNTMSDPVLLPGSKKICDRKVIMLHLKKRKTDPFVNVRLMPHMLQPCNDLKQEICAYKERTSADPHERESIMVDNDGIRRLAEKIGDTIASDLLEAVLDAEKLQHMGTEKAAPRPEVEVTHASSAPGLAVPAAPMLPVVIPDEHTMYADEEGEEDVVMQDADDNDGTFANAPLAMPAAMREKLERKTQNPRVVSVNDNKIIMFQPGNGVRPFLMSSCFEGYGQDGVYRESVAHCVERTLSGGNACVLCYGQTGSGKTHTMFGNSSTEGVAEKAIKEVLCASTILEKLGVDVRMKASYIQIYGKELSCLLSGSEVQMLRDNKGTVNLTGCEEIDITNENDVAAMLSEGQTRKRMAATRMNETSSRSHTIISLEVMQNFKGNEVSSKLCLVDLAGSERVKKSNVTGNALKEAVAINKSLLVLGRCMTSLSRRSHHVPFGESRLTLMLRSSLGGGCSTSIIVCCRKDDKNAAETLQTLRFAETCSAISSTTRDAAASVPAALRLIGKSLEKCKATLATLVPGTSEHESLFFNYCSLLRKRSALLDQDQDKHRNRS